MRRTPLGAGVRETVLGVALSLEGAITSLEVRTSSGVAELEDEAIRAFQISSPFGPPPDGRGLKPFTLGFRFEIGAGTGSTIVEP